MANNDGFIDFLSPNAISQLEKGEKILDRIVDKINGLNAAAPTVRLPGEGRGINAGARRTAEEIANNRILARNANQAALANSALAGAYGRLNAQTAIAARRYQDIIARGQTATQTQRQYNQELQRAQSEWAGLNTRVIAANRAIGRYNDNVGNYPARAIAGIKDLLGAFGVAGGLYLVAQVAKDIFNTTKEIQGLDLALKQVLGTQEGFIQSQEFLQRISEAYGVEINSLTRSYTGFYAASKNAIDAGQLTAQQIQSIFESVSKASGALGLSVDQQQGAFLALQQIISKGNVQAEEIRGQLAERLPGAFGILAKSMGVTEQELNKLLKDGKVLAAEVLPAFAKELERAYGVQNLNYVRTLNAETTRLGNTWTDLIRTFSEGESPISKFFIGIVSSIKTVVEGFDRLFQSAQQKQDKRIKDYQQFGYDNTTKQLNDLNVNNRTEAVLNAQTIINNSDERLVRLRQERSELRQNIDTLEEQIKLEQKSYFGNPRALGKLKNQLKQYRTELTKNELTAQSTLGDRGAAVDFLNPAPEVTTGFRNTGKTEKVGYENPRDYLAAEFEARKRYLEYEKQVNKEIVDNTENAFADREAAAKRYFALSSEMALMDAQEQERQINFAAEEDIKATKRRKLTAENRAEVINSIERKAIADVKASYESYGLTVLSLNKEIEDSLKDVYKNITQQERQNKLDEQRIDNLKQIKSLYDEVDSNSGIKQFADIENSIRRITDTEEMASIAELETQREVIDAEIAKIALKEKNEKNNQRINELRGQQLALETQIVDKQKQQSENIAKVREQTEASMRQFLEGISGNSLDSFGFSSLTSLFDTVTYQVVNSLGEIETRTGSTFKMLFDQADTLKEKFTVAFNTFSNFAKQTAAFIQQNQQASFDNERYELEKQKTITEGFAESEEARQKINDDFEERRRDIRRREAEANKSNAIFNASINIAQGVTSAYASGNLILAGLIAALGLIQIQNIRNREIPAYKMGTNFHPGGQAVVGDGFKKELIYQPKAGWSISPAVPTLMDLERGSKVYPDLAKAGVLNSGLQPLNSNRGNSKSKTIVNEVPNLFVEFDEAGVKKYMRKGYNIHKDFQSKVSFKGKSV